MANYLKWRAEECHQAFLNNAKLTEAEMITLRERENAYTDILEIPEELDRIKETLDKQKEVRKELGL